MDAVQDALGNPGATGGGSASGADHRRPGGTYHHGAAVRPPARAGVAVDCDWGRRIAPSDVPVEPCPDPPTKRTGESKVDAAVRASVRPRARLVKLCDNMDNTDPVRVLQLAEQSPEDAWRLARVYREVREVLCMGEP